MTVLVVDDQKDVATALAVTVASCDHEVIGVVGSGMDAIRSYTQAKPDVVLMDYQMPGFNGVTACRHIRSRDPAARIVLLTGNLDPDDWAFIDSGAHAVLTKPFSTGKLKALLLTLQAALVEPVAIPATPLPVAC